MNVVFDGGGVEIRGRTLGKSNQHVTSQGRSFLTSPHLPLTSFSPAGPNSAAVVPPIYSSLPLLSSPHRVRGEETPWFTRTVLIQVLGLTVRELRRCGTRKMFMKT